MLIVPHGQRLKYWNDLLEHVLGAVLIGLGLLVDEELGIVLGQLVEEVDLLRDIGQHLGALLEKRGDSRGVIRGVLHAPADIRLRRFGKVLGAHGADILAVEVAQLVNVKDRGGLGNTGKVKDIDKLVHAEYLLLAARAPAEERDIVDDGVSQVALGDKILIGWVAVALGHLVVRVAHDGRAVDILRDVPAEALVQQVVLRGGGEILAAAHDVGDAHEVVVNDICEVIGRQSVAL